MASNLVLLVTQLLTSEMIAKIASALGLDRNLVQKMITGAVPSLLASVADVASTPSGARQLTNALTQQQSGSLDGVLAKLTQGSGTDALMNAGSSMLSGLFGGGALDTMSQAIGEFSKFQQVPAQHARSGGSRSPRPASAQFRPGCKWTCVPPHFAKATDRGSHSVRPC